MTVTAVRQLRGEDRDSEFALGRVRGAFVEGRDRFCFTGSATHGESFLSATGPKPVYLTKLAFPAPERSNTEDR